MTDEQKQHGLNLLRVPFPPHHVNYVPRGGVNLAFVGHAAITDRLLDADPSWSWEPLAVSPEGLPVMDTYGGMWIRLTVCGVTRLGYGHAGNKEGGDAIKEVLGDAIRNSAMRFGCALDLWHKGDLHAPEQLSDADIAALIEPIKTAKTSGMFKAAVAVALKSAEHDARAQAMINAAAQEKAKQAKRPEVTP